MSENKENTSKPRTLRLEEETMDRLREIAYEIGGNQQQTVSKLIEAYDFQKGKAILTDRLDDIEKFEDHITLISRMYMTTLQENHTMTETVRMEFAAQLQSKDLLIQELQEKVREGGDLKEAWKNEGKRLKGELQTALSQIEGLQEDFARKTQDYELAVKDKEKLNEVLTATCEKQSSELIELQEQIHQAKEVENENQLLKECQKQQLIKIQDLEQQLKDQVRMEEEFENKQKQQIEDLKKKYDFEREKCVFAMEKEYQKKLYEKQREFDQFFYQKQQEIDAYQEKWKELIQENKELTTQIQEISQHSKEESEHS